MSAAHDRRGRLGGVATRRGQALGDQRQVLDPHVEHERAGKCGERGPVERGLGLLGILVAGDERDGRGVVAVGDRDPGVGRDGDAGRHARNDLELDPSRGQGLGLLAAAAEYEWVAAFEANHAAPGACVLDDQRLDLRLSRIGAKLLQA